jgi:hypothetical protein
MQAKPGDRIVIRGHRVGDSDRDGKVIEAHGPDGGPPYLVRWRDTEHDTLFFPGADSGVQPSRTRKG